MTPRAWVRYACPDAEVYDTSRHNADCECHHCIEVDPHTAIIAQGSKDRVNSVVEAMRGYMCACGKFLDQEYKLYEPNEENCMSNETREQI